MDHCCPGPARRRWVGGSFVWDWHGSDLATGKEFCPPGVAKETARGLEADFLKLNAETGAPKSKVRGWGRPVSLPVLPVRVRGSGGAGIALG